MTLALYGGKPVCTLPMPARPQYGIAERNAANAVVASGNLSGFLADPGEAFRGGPMVRALEDAWCERFGCKYAVAMNSATSCLFGAVKAVGVEPRDEVIVPSWSMSASATCVLAAGAVPVFADVDPETYGLDPDSVLAKVTPRTKAIVSVDLFGLPGRSLYKITSRYPRVKIIEDTAQAIGATIGTGGASSSPANWKTIYAGTRGDVGVYSLNRHKTIQCGEGGVAVTDDAETAKYLRGYRNHGEVLGNEAFRQGHVGGNYRMGEVEAAIAEVQLARLAELTAPRIANAAALTEGLADLDGIFTPVVPPGVSHVYYLYAVRIKEKLPGLFHTALRAEGVPVGRYVEPLYRIPALRGYGALDDTNDWNGWYPEVERAWREVVVLPYVHAGMDDDDLDGVVEAFRKVWMSREKL